MTKLFQISEDDLERLEHVLPRLMDQAAFSGDPFDGMLGNKNLFRKHWREIKEIVSNIRWNYGPPLQVETLPAGSGDQVIDSVTQPASLIRELEEGDSCPESADDPCPGRMQIYTENCSCHINGPCDECLKGRLKCSKCGYIYDPGESA